MDGHLPGVPAVRLSSRLHLSSFFAPSGRRGRAGSPPALMADVRVVIKRRVQVGPFRVVEEVAEDITLRRQPSRKLRRPEHVEQALAADVIPLVEHPLDRGAVVAARKEICAYVSGACGNPRLANSGVQVLVLLEIFATPLLRVPRKLTWTGAGARKNNIAVMKTSPCLELEPAKKIRPVVGATGDAVPVNGVKIMQRSVGVIGDRRPKAALEEERYKGWLPWQAVRSIDLADVQSSTCS